MKYSIYANLLTRDPFAYAKGFVLPFVMWELDKVSGQGYHGAKGGPRRLLLCTSRHHHAAGNWEDHRMLPLYTLFIDIPGHFTLRYNLEKPNAGHLAIHMALVFGKGP